MWILHVLGKKLNVDFISFEHLKMNAKMGRIKIKQLCVLHNQNDENYNY